MNYDYLDRISSYSISSASGDLRTVSWSPIDISFGKSDEIDKLKDVVHQKEQEIERLRFENFKLRKDLYERSGKNENLEKEK